MRVYQFRHFGTRRGGKATGSRLSRASAGSHRGSARPIHGAPSRRVAAAFLKSGIAPGIFATDEARANGAERSRCMTPDSIVARNRKAFHDYEILETFEAGLVLTGPEVKSIRNGRVNLKDGYAGLTNGELFLHNVHVSPYEAANRYNAEPTRPRKLLLHKPELRRLVGRAAEKGLTIVPLDVHFSRGYAKVTLALARGKKQYDKREAIRRREMDRELERAARDG